nr:hypothetical protein [Tanacetum cinerariifolium]
MAYSSISSNSEVSTDSICSSSCLENAKILKEQNEQLLKDVRTSKLNAITYKTGLESVEARLLVYKKIESVYEEDIKVQFRRTSLTGFPAQSIRSSNAMALDSPYLLVLITRTSQSRQQVVRQPTAFKSERPKISKPRFASQVDVNNDLPKPVTTHYLPRERESAFAKPHHMIAPSSSRYSSTDMVHNHYLEEAKKKTHKSGRNSRPSVMPSAKSQNTGNSSKPKPRRSTQTSRNWPASKNSFVMTKTVPIAEHYRNSRIFSDSKHFVCSTCQKCIFNANHDTCVMKFLNEVNSHAKVPSNKTTNKNKPIDQTSFAKKPERQIPTGHRFSIKKTFIVYEKTTSPRSCPRWKSTCKIFKTVGLMWVSTRKIFTSSTTKVDSEPTNGSNDDITNQYECE